MADISPDALSLEAPTIESQPIQPDAPEPEPIQAADDSEPEGAVDVQGRRMVDVSVLAAERRRVREATERAIREKEIEPLRRQADENAQLRQALAETQPYVNYLRQHPELLQPQKPTPLEDQVSDQEAADEARDLELYDQKTGQPDLARAKRIIARRRQDSMSAAQQATQAAIGPITSQTAQQTSRQNFVTLATRRDAQNQPLVDAKVLAEYWAQLPPELTQHAEVGELVLDAAICKQVRAGGRVARPDRAPVVSEPAGGRVGPGYAMDKMAKSLAQHAGISDKAFTDSAKSFVPGMPNVIGD